MNILDACCGSKMFWFDKNNKNVLFADCRVEDHILCDGRQLKISPENVHDFKNMPYQDNTFKLVVFDPPHFRSVGKKSWMYKKYGSLNKDSWKNELEQGFKECWRVLCKNGTLIFKWNETQIKLKELLSCFPEKPLFGHTTTQNLKTHWIVFNKIAH